MHLVVSSCCVTTADELIPRRPKRFNDLKTQTFALGRYESYLFKPTDRLIFIVGKASASESNRSAVGENIELEHPNGDVVFVHSGPGIAVDPNDEIICVFHEDSVPADWHYDPEGGLLVLIQDISSSRKASYQVKILSADLQMAQNLTNEFQRGLRNLDIGHGDRVNTSIFDREKRVLELRFRSGVVVEAFFSSDHVEVGLAPGSS
ncbi:hypothetical protein [Neorhodopirellula pilleata]|nr:hypothetical protein [Neorhodopirellula pilleata]